MKKIYWILLLTFTLTVSAKSQKRGLEIRFVDVEGGAATLIVTPLGESVLVDTGWKRDDNRDALRIMKAARDAGLQKIDHLVTTHFHRDHYGGVLALSQMIPIAHFYDHGAMTALAEDKDFAALYSDYNKATGGRQIHLRPGDTIPLTAGKKIPILLRCVVSAREPLAAPPGAPLNRLCEDLQPQPADPSDNSASVGLHLKYGAFDFLDLGDLTRAMEAKLVCPVNVIGRIDLYQVTHHGNDTSNLPILIESIRPSVAIINNGPAKGGNPQTFDVLKSMLSIKDIFQLHRNLQTADWNNAPPSMIANMENEEQCRGNGIRVMVSEDSKSFVVINERFGPVRKPIPYRVE